VKHQDTKFDDKEKNNNKKNFESGGRNRVNTRDRNECFK